MIDWKTFNPGVIAEFRANGGQVRQFPGLLLVILHTLGARSGRVREVPLITVLDGDDMLIFGSSAGAATHPDWYFNLKANPRIIVDCGQETFTADLIELPEAASQEKLQYQAEVAPQFAAYVAAAAPRIIPVFKIVRV